MEVSQIKGLVFDLEVHPKNNTVFKIGALRMDTSWSLERDIRNDTELKNTLKDIDVNVQGALCVIGHNVLEHDLPILKQKFSDLEMLHLPIVDTLRLSPLSFPQNPYHRLIKDYKIISSSLSSPLADCQATVTLFNEQYIAFQDLATQNYLELRCYQSLLWQSGMPAFYFSELTKESLPLDMRSLQLAIIDILKETDKRLNRDFKVCKTRLKTLIEQDLYQVQLHIPIAYVLAWLRVSGGNSILAPWVKYQFPKVMEMITELRDVPCSHEKCQYCQSVHNPRSELKHYFGYDDFRYEDDGTSVQFDVTLASMRGKNVLAILPTGGGKSLCYQLPALNRYYRNGSLNIIISPLQSLMKDQVDGLLHKHEIHSAATLNGMLSLPERADVLEKIKMGDIGLLLVSPEQFRNKAFQQAISQRNIGAWIYDEAHCLSKWGNDFRPDYLYVAKFIKKFTGNNPLAPISCFTATAKPDVMADIRSHFSDILGISFYERTSFQERENLAFDVLPCAEGEKTQYMHQLLTEILGNECGGAVIFVSSRKKAENYSQNLKKLDWNCQHFHAGLLPNEKKDIQDDFIQGKIQIIVATNAFGMGVDKPDVRLVIHADIPGSLENYIQEAGRAGRDQGEAKCILLYDANDIETQFGLSERSKLSQHDINGIYRKLRKESSRRHFQDVVITAGEILNDITVQTSIDIEEHDAQTKVNTAIAWLERGEYLERTDNRTQVFPAHRELTLEAALDKLAKANLSIRKQQDYSAVVQYLYSANDDEMVNTDYLMHLTGNSNEEIAATLRALEALKILSNDTEITAFVRYGIADASLSRLQASIAREKALLAVLSELEPDMGHESWFNLHMGELVSHLQLHLDDSNLLPIHIQQLLYSISQELDGDSRSKNALKIRSVSREHWQIKFQSNKTWADIRGLSERRCAVATVLLNALLVQLGGQKGKDLLVKATFSELEKVVFGDLSLDVSIASKNQKAAIEHVLLYLHQQDIIVLNNGMTVMRRAMTIKVNQDKQKNRYLKSDFELLQEHYKERRIQIHVMREYAEKALHGMAEALNLVLDYFTMELKAFRERYFSGRETILSLATSEDSWQKIVHQLNHWQREIVEDRQDNNRLILAGPGSGKTRVVVHRIAYLLRVERISATSIIALAFNRHAAIEIRKRLYDLVGKEAYGLTVLTYHSMAMRLTGTRFSRGQGFSEQSMQEVIEKAVSLLEGNNALEGEDDLRDTLLRGYRYIVVDEYQDIDAWQYRLVSALSGRQSLDEDGKLCILAVGDDDQNIYSFRHSSNSYIQQFCQDYLAQTTYLTQNYRSSLNIIQAANSVINLIPNRLKTKHPIEIDQDRVSKHKGGVWEDIDPIRKGEVLHIALPRADVAYGYAQAQAVMQELQRLQDIHFCDWSECAVLARTHEYLYPIQTYCELMKIPYHMASDKNNAIPLTRQREFLQFIGQLKSGESKPKILELWLRELEWADLDESWQQFFQDAFVELSAELVSLPVSANEMIDYLYEYAQEMRQKAKQGLFIGTVYAAKGLEFKHVMLLDGAWGEHGVQFEDECRVYYVGMTRAKETLTVCDFGLMNPFCKVLSHVLQQEYVNTQMLALENRYQTLSLKDVHLGFFSEMKHQEARNRIASLKIGDRLTLLCEDGNWNVYCMQTNLLVGRLAKSFVCNIDVEICEVAAIITRYREEDTREYKTHLCESWEVVIPRIQGVVKNHELRREVALHP